MTQRRETAGYRRNGRRAATRAALALVAAACAGDDSPSGPDVEAIAAGRAAFASECAICHTALDGFDVALFGFADADIVRRAVKHVDESTANEIVAYIHSLDVTPIGRDVAPFQPGGDIVASDTLFWRTLFQTDGWPDDLTPAALRAIDVRNTPVALRFPLWSVEEAETDWLPDLPLDSALAEHADGALRAAVQAFQTDPSAGTLNAAIQRFRQASEASGGPCAGPPSGEARARECFQARRWMSAMAAVDVLRNRTAPTEIPLEVLDLWWDTGKVAQSLFLQEPGQHPFDMVSGWLYLAYSFNPTRFRNEGGYLEQFLQLGGQPRMATFAALRRMVAAEDVHDPVPAQRFSDAYVAAVRGPASLRAGVTRFAFEFLIDWLDDSGTLDEDSRAEAAFLVNALYSDASKLTPDQIEPGELAVLAGLRDRLLSRI